MPAVALAFAIAAAFLHAFWNLLLARARDPEAATAVMLLIALLAYAPVAALTWDLERPAIPYLVVTSFLQLVYTALLAAAYRRAELSVVYPISRGTAPVLVLPLACRRDSRPLTRHPSVLGPGGVGQSSLVTPGLPQRGAVPPISAS